jgi:signal transduction histidine kinase
MLFLAAAAIAFSVLGWVTHSALAVERGQREAAARAELESNLRVALWRLDGRMLPAFGVEDSRPFYHYGPVDPNYGYGVAATPLLVTALPNWMKLHFQLDAACGWESPQVLAPEVAERVRATWPDLPLRNVGPEREAVLAECRSNYPAREMLETFAARDRAIPADLTSLSSPSEPIPSDRLQVPAPTSQPPANEPAGAPVQPTGTPKRRTVHFLGIEIGLKAEAKSTSPNQLLPDNDRTNSIAPAAPKGAMPGPGGYGGLRTRNSMSKDLDNNSSAADAANRARTINRGMNDVQPPPGTIQPKGQGSSLANDLQSNMPTNNTTSGLGQNSLGQATNALSGPASTPGISPPVSAGAIGGSLPGAAAQAAAPRPNKDSTESKGAEDRKGNDPAKENRPVWDAAEADRKRANRDAKAPSMPLPSAAGSPNPFCGPGPMAIHLGSMRPQWAKGRDGSEMLVLVRVANVDGRSVCQGIVLDWVELQAMLRDEVKDLFPNARLIPIEDAAAVPPDRAMTALPVQLDPGAQPELPSAGLTTLRLGLLMAWAAALVAFAAVGFCGWALIDLAERRIRFASAVTHELRTPLTSLRLYLDLLVSGMIQEEAKKQEYLNTLATESDRLHRLIDNVLDFARLEKQRKGQSIAPVAVAEAIERLRLTWTDRLAQDGKELVVVSTLPEGQIVRTDAAMLQQILGNLIDNARKYSREAADNRVWVWAKPGIGKTILIEVEDRGPGVPAKERRPIFKPFRRGAEADHTSGGAGLGLALAKSWAELLGGKLTYRPADGGTGACFRLELSLR